jgi:hypothetical protein
MQPAKLVHYANLSGLNSGHLHNQTAIRKVEKNRILILSGATH